MKRYSAKLLFQYRSKTGKEPKRLCEERIITFEARGPRHALQVARSNGRKAQFEMSSPFWKNCSISRYVKQTDGDIFFEFVGVMDLVELSTICESNEVWYEFHCRRAPVDKLIPTDDHLLNRT